MSTWVAVYNDRLEPILERKRIHRGEQLTTLPDTLSTAVAYADGQLMVAFHDRDGAGLDHAYARILDLSGNFTTDVFDLSEQERFEQGQVALAAYADGGFIATWESRRADADAEDDASGMSLRSALFDREGQRRFVNLACGNTDFQLNAEHEGDQRSPSIALMGDGTPIVVWTDAGPNEAKLRRRSQVRSVILPDRELLPIR